MVVGFLQVVLTLCLNSPESLLEMESLDVDKSGRLVKLTMRVLIYSSCTKRGRIHPKLLTGFVQIVSKMMIFRFEGFGSGFYIQPFFFFSRDLPECLEIVSPYFLSIGDAYNGIRVSVKSSIGISLDLDFNLRALGTINLNL